jgi:hypothetical protein
MYNGLTSKDPVNASTAMYRLHEADAIHFRNRIKFQFVNPWSPERLQPFAWSSAAFYYLNSPAGPMPKLPGTDDLLVWYRIKNTDHQSIP